MDAISVGSSPPPTIPSKRSAPDEPPLNLKGNQFLIPSPPTTTGDGSPARAMPTPSARETSPAASISTLSSVQDISSTGNPEPRTTNGAPAAKKRKLTLAEKAEQQQLKDAKAQEKAEQKRVKDEEKRVKDEEKRRKGEEREVKKREKELVEERKNQEKLKKERSQMRLGVFFQRPAAAVRDGSNSREPSPDKAMARRRSLSLETFDTVREQIVKGAEPTGIDTKVADPVSDYHKFFLPYEPKPFTTLPDHAVVAGPSDAQTQFDFQLRPSSEHFDLGLCPASVSLSEHFRAHRGGRRGVSVIHTKTLWQRSQSSAQRPIDLTGAEQAVDANEELGKIPVRYLHFHEDVRPAYYGTYTRVEGRSIKKLRHNPFSRVRTDTNYDHDSEAEWEDADPDDEDLDNEDDDDESLGDEEEMEGFLDDEDDELKAKRRLVVSDLEAHSSGLCWEDHAGRLQVSASASPTRAMKGLRLQFLLPGPITSIDPFSTSYWHTEDAKPATDNLKRPPLKERSSNTASVNPENGWPIGVTPKTQSGAKKGMKPGTQKTMNAEELEHFRDQVVGSAMGKAELIAQLKANFPNLTVVLVKDTLSEKFAQVGKSKADKKWVFVGSA